MFSREIFSKKCQQQQIFDSDLKKAWHYNHVTFTPIAKHFMLYCRLIYMLSILCVRLTIKVKVGIPESFKVGWYPPKKLGRVTLNKSSGTIHMMSSISFFNDLQFYLVFGLKHLPNHQKQHAVVPKISSAFPNSRTL